MKRVLVTGHTGFIGTALFKKLMQMESTNVSGASRATGFDLTQSDSLNSIASADVVFHLAGAVGVGIGWQKPESIYRSNFLSTLTVLEYCRRHSAKMVYLSSYMYGRPEKLPIDEADPVQCLSPYARSKHFGELLCEGYARDFNMDCTIVRPFNVYGLGEPDSSIIGSIFAQLSRNSKISLQSLDTRRDFLYLQDLADFLVLLHSRVKSGFHVYNIGSGQSHSPMEIIALLERILNKKLTVETRGEARKNEIADCYSDNSRIRNEFGFVPLTSLSDGLTIMAAEILKR